MPFGHLMYCNWQAGGEKGNHSQNAVLGVSDKPINIARGMLWKIYYKNPTEIIFGRNRLHALKDQLLTRGYRSALVLYGGSHWKENGTLEQITTQLKACSISCFVQAGDTSQS